VVLGKGFLDKVNAVAKRLWSRLEDIAAKHPAVFEGVTGSGLMVGLKCVPVNTDVVAKLTQGGLLTVAAGDNVVRLVPPLIIEDSHVDEALSIIEKAAEELGSAPEAALETGRD